MKKKLPKQRYKQKQPVPKPKRERPQIALRKRNYIIMGIGLGTIIAGFITLANGSITIAPLLLVVGYCVLIPVSLLVK
ncbi:hypothetical protein CH330_05555 [candidate division WOR-3 bacterium JGI_Cruoil_03_51_56]|uniref:DUF3098 domain-containing protein n=1 Tax=candidate division WOR-3 bacterium JGI_Cruoil_03_51_56 TaxID=1973747 RepID=A0A235BUR4_UNCW3|nr:MAG: hypothetical protein CH330_05555 [candidate division WOR-3 bacterium JGI_Cruoil_03_51_56]